MAEDVKYASAKEIKPGRYIIIDGVPCRAVKVEVSKPGKHGAAKVRITAVGIFDGQKKVWLGPSDAEVEVPVIKKRRVQVLSVSGNAAQVMDKESYEVFEVNIPEELAGEVSEGKEVELMEALGRFMIVRVFKE